MHIHHEDQFSPVTLNRSSRLGIGKGLQMRLTLYWLEVPNQQLFDDDRAHAIGAAP